MAKKVIQMYDKYKSTTKIYPKVIKECFQEDAQEYIEGQVKANPTLAGTEAGLTGLEVGGTKYKVEQPINVVANPTLAGTEADLEGIEIGDTKYKIGGGKQLYQHNITAFDASNSNRLIVKIINDSNTPFTFSSLVSFLKTNGFIRTTVSPYYQQNTYQASGQWFNDSNKWCVITEINYSDDTHIYVYGLKTGENGTYNDSRSASHYGTFNDIVIAL